jgi:FAD/FMN-containing dehydrogenase
MPQAQPITGWNPTSRSWTSDSDPVSVIRTPLLQGELCTTADVLADAACDLGRVKTAVPSAVLRPRSAEDVARMIEFCRLVGLRVAAQGAGHMTFGQRLVPHGVAIDMTSLQQVHALGETWVDCDAGVLWSDLVPQLAARGLRFAGGLTGYLSMTVGGTLSAGGVSPNFRSRAQIDAVRRIQVATGSGELVWASATENPDLLVAALGGLGQAGIITRAVLELAPAPVRVHSWKLPYLSPADAFAAMRTILCRDAADELYCMILPPARAQSRPPIFLVHVAFYTDGTSAAASAADLDEVPAWYEDSPSEMSRSVVSRYVAHVSENSSIIDQWRLRDGWDDLLKVCFDAFLGDTVVEGFATSTVAEMTDDDWSLPDQRGFVSLFPIQLDQAHSEVQQHAQRRSRLRMPHDGSGVAWLFDISRAAPKNPDAMYLRRTLERNRDLLTAALDLGGVRYPIGSQDVSAEDWQRHYGDTWPEVKSALRRYNPEGLLNPGPGIATAVA